MVVTCQCIFLLVSCNQCTHSSYVPAICDIQRTSVNKYLGVVQDTVSRNTNRHPTNNCHVGGHLLPKESTCGTVSTVLGSCHYYNGGSNEEWDFCHHLFPVVLLCVPSICTYVCAYRCTIPISIRYTLSHIWLNSMMLCSCQIIITNIVNITRLISLLFQVHMSLFYWPLSVLPVQYPLLSGVLKISKPEHHMSWSIVCCVLSCSKYSQYTLFVVIYCLSWSINERDM